MGLNSFKPGGDQPLTDYLRSRPWPDLQKKSPAWFEKASGSRLNQSKSKGLWLGSWVGYLDLPVALDWSQSKHKVP